MEMKTLIINSSVQTDKSVTRKLVGELVQSLTKSSEHIVERDLANGVPLLTQEMVNAFYTPEDKRTTAQKELVAFSDILIKELQDADNIVIGAPIYNFSIPGSLKAYFDLVARVGITFKYTEKGPIGQLNNKKAFVVIASGGVGFRSEADFASDYIKQFLGFIGITDIIFIPADRLVSNADKALANARSIIAEVSNRNIDLVNA